MQAASESCKALDMDTTSSQCARAGGRTVSHCKVPLAIRLHSHNATLRGVLAVRRWHCRRCIPSDVLHNYWNDDCVGCARHGVLRGCAVSFDWWTCHKHRCLLIARVVLVCDHCDFHRSVVRCVRTEVGKRCLLELPNTSSDWQQLLL